jgi:hypothetical protein
MAAKLLLSISNDQATAAVWRGHRLASCKVFENDQAGWTAFGSYLGGLHGLPVHIIVDTVEEDFRFETLPHVRGSDRTEMVRRKLKQLYRATPYYSYALQEREAGKRRDDRYLFAALTSADLLIPWLRAIEVAAMPVSGIYPQALVSVALIERLKLKHPNLLVITKNAAGLRQTFFKDLKFRISRLTPLRGIADAGDAQYADEVANTRMYLDALTVTHVDDIMEVIIVDQEGSLSRLGPAIMRERPNTRCQYLNIDDIHARFGIPVAELQTSPDALQLYLLGEQAPTLNLAPAYLTRSYQRFAAGRWVYAASGAMLLSAVVWSGVNYYRTTDIERDISLRDSRRRTIKPGTSKSSRSFPMPRPVRTIFVTLSKSRSRYARPCGHQRKCSRSSAMRSTFRLTSSLSASSGTTVIRWNPSPARNRLRRLCRRSPDNSSRLVPCTAKSSILEATIARQ